MSSVAAEFGMLSMLFLAVISKQKASCTNNFVSQIFEYHNTEMVRTFFFFFVGELVLLVLLSSFYIFQYVICPTILVESEQAELKDPIKGFARFLDDLYKIL